MQQNIFMLQRSWMYACRKPNHTQQRALLGELDRNKNQGILTQQACTYSWNRKGVDIGYGTM